MNTIMIVGNLGKDPEQRYTPNGRKVTTFNVASNRTWKDDQGEKHEAVTWFRCEAWNGLGESVAKYLKKGRKVLVVGRVDIDSRQDVNGIWQTYVKVVCNQVEFLDPAPGQTSPPQSVDEERIPF